MKTTQQKWVLLRRLSIVPALLLGLILAVEGQAADPSAESKAADNKKEFIRLYFERGSQKLYFNGFHWERMRVTEKISLVERARRGAVKMNVLMMQPAEIYVRELDRMYQQRPETRRIEVGQAIQGIAVSLKDWDEMERSGSTQTHQ